MKNFLLPANPGQRTFDQPSNRLRYLEQYVKWLANLQIARFRCIIFHLFAALQGASSECDFAPRLHHQTLAYPLSSVFFLQILDQVPYAVSVWLTLNLQCGCHVGCPYQLPHADKKFYHHADLCPVRCKSALLCFVAYKKLASEGNSLLLLLQITAGSLLKFASLLTTQLRAQTVKKILPCNPEQFTTLFH